LSCPCDLAEVEHIKDTVRGLLQDWATKKESPGIGAPESWLKKALTKKEQEHIRFNYFRKGILGVSVDSSSWLYKLTLKKEDLLKRLNKRFAQIKDINFRIGELE
jgi:hypothetical protein